MGEPETKCETVQLAKQLTFSPVSWPSLDKYPCQDICQAKTFFGFFCGFCCPDLRAFLVFLVFWFFLVFFFVFFAL